MTLLAKFCDHYGLDEAHIREPVVPGGYKENFEILNADPTSFTGEVRSISCKFLGRFGNIVCQTLHATLFARQTGIFAIGVVGGHKPGPSSLPRKVRDILYGLDHSALGGPTVAAQFFWPGPLRRYLRDVSPQLLSSTLREYLMPLYDGIYVRDDIRPDTVVVHVRSGDIFREGNFGCGWINPRYVQPPASYYIMAIEECRRRFAVKDVLIVYEGLANPCLAELTSQLLRHRIPFSAQSLSVEEDVGALAGASHIISSFGTFSEGAATLSRHLKTFWFFRQLESHQEMNGRAVPLLADILHNKGVQIMQIDDIAGTYIAPMTWANSEDQRSLMVDIPGRMSGRQERFAPLRGVGWHLMGCQ